MKFFYYLYCIVFFAIAVVAAMLLDLSSWLVKVFTRVRECIKKFCKRAYWSILRHSKRFCRRSR